MVSHGFKVVQVHEFWNPRRGARSRLPTTRYQLLDVLTAGLLFGNTFSRPAGVCRRLPSISDAQRVPGRKSYSKLLGFCSSGCPFDTHPMLMQVLLEGVFRRAGERLGRAMCHHWVLDCSRSCYYRAGSPGCQRLVFFQIAESCRGSNFKQSRGG